MNRKVNKICVTNFTKIGNFRPLFPVKLVFVKKYLWGLPLILLAAFALFGKSALFRFLATTERVDTDLLVIEGWTDREGLARAAEEISAFGYQRVIVASLVYPFDSTYAYEVSNTGGLVFDLSLSSPSDDSITIYAASNDLHGIPAHFKLWVNDSLVGETYTQASLAPYSFALPDTTPVRTVTVDFDNDGLEKGVGDRDLIVESVRLGGHTFYARMPNVRYDLGAIDGLKLRRTDPRSEADWAMDILRSHGVPDSIMMSVAAPLTRYDKTFATARAVRDWLARQGSLPLALNLFSESAHARRSQLLFRKAMGDQTRVGVISVPRKEVRADNWWQHRSSASYTLWQVVKYVYARLFFWPDTASSSSD